jgi:uncharacterized membrane protein YhfC
MTPIVTVPAASILFITVSLLLSIGVPIALLIILSIRWRGAAGSFFAGTLGFFIPQALIRIPILQALGSNEVYLAFAKNYTVLYALLLAFTAGLFETTGRLFIFKLLLRDRYSYAAGFAAGAGHGGIEAIYLVGLTYINNLVLSLMINSGSSAGLSALLPQKSLSAAVDSLAKTPSTMFLLGGVERVFTIVFHIAMSVLLLSFIVKGRTLAGFAVVTGLHTCLDFAAVLIQTSGAGILLTEGIVLLAAAASAWYLLHARGHFPGSVGIPGDAAEKAVDEGF